MPLTRRNVTSVAKSGSTKIKGDVTLSEGANVTLTQSGSNIAVAASSSGAPTDATYITQTANGSLSNEQALGSLATGIMKSTTTTGVVSIAAEGTDYYKPGGTDVVVLDGGTGASTASGARTNLGLVIGSDVLAPAGDGTALTLSRIGASTYSTIQHLMNLGVSAGRSSGGAITAAASANQVDVAAGTGFMKATDSDVATLSFFDWSASAGVSVPSNTTRYIGVQYNSGSPNVVAKTADSWDLDTEFPLGIVVNEGGTRYIYNIPWITADNMTNVIERFDSQGIKRDERVGGLILANTGTRNVTVSTGTLLARMSEISVSAIDTSGSGTFDAYYRDGASGWTKESAQTQVNNTKYDDGTGTLHSITALSYASRWFYICADGSLVMLYGRADYTALATALNDSVPSSAPDRVVKGGLLIGRLIYQASGVSPTSTQTAFGTAFTAAGVTSASDLSNGVTGSGAIVLASSPTLTTPALGTPSALVGTNITGTAAGLTAGNVTTNANLTGPITSVGNATSIASQTGTGTKFVVDTSPTLVTPTIGAATATTINKVTITAPASSATLTIANGKTLTVNNSLTLAGTDSTTMTFPSTSATIARTDAANTFTGHQTIEGVTSTGATGTGKLVFDNTPTLVTPNIGVATATSVNKLTLTAPTSAATLTLVDGSSLITSGAFAATLTSTATTNVTLPTSGTLATLTGTEILTNKELSGGVVESNAFQDMISTQSISLPASRDFNVIDGFELAAVHTFELPATSTLEVVPTVKQTEAQSYFGLFDFIESGCVWSADTVGSTLLASMSAGYVWISGRRLRVNSVRSRAFIASKDTYVDFSDNGDGTAKITYTETTNNLSTGSPSLAQGSLRNAIIISGATSIAAAGSINQGDPACVLPIVSSIAYSVTDSLGNLICNRNSSLTLIGYRQIVATFTSGGTADADVTGLSCLVFVPEGRKVCVTFFSPQTYASVDGNRIDIGLQEDGTDIQRNYNRTWSVANGGNGGTTVIAEKSPTTGLHTYKVRVGTGIGGGVGSVFSAAATPSFIKVELV